MTFTATATATATGYRYSVTIDGETVEFSHKRPFTHLIMGQYAGGGWRLRLRTNSPRGAETRELVRMERNRPGDGARVITVPVT